MNTTEITVVGLIATTPRHLITQEMLPITSFRLAQTVKRWNPSTSVWEDETNWYTVVAYKQLALNTSTSLNKGDRIIVTGSLRVRDWDNGERAGTNVEIEAFSIGHDYRYGNGVFTRTQLIAPEAPALLPYEY